MTKVAVARRLEATSKENIWTLDQAVDMTFHSSVSPNSSPVDDVGMHWLMDDTLL